MRARILVVLAALAASTQAFAAETVAPPSREWSFSGFFGTYDRASLQRGLQVYKEVCAACHGAYQLRYRNLGELGYSEDEVKAFAAQYEVPDINDAGEAVMRPARPSDPFKRPFANERAARAANNGAYPVDLSMVAKARKDGHNYIVALLTGYGNPPAGVQVLDGLNYNRYFPGGQIAMSPPLSADQLTFADGTKATVEQMAVDVTTFLAWAAEPEMEARKRLGVKVVLFLLVLTGLLYAVKRKVWAKLH